MGWSVWPFKRKETKAEETKAEEPKAEETKAEEPKAEETKAEEPKAEETKAEDLKAEEPKAEEMKAEEPKAEKPKAKELKAEETKKEEHIREVEFLPEEQKTKKRDFIEVEGRPLDRKQLEDEAIITINPIAGQSDSEE